MSQYKVWLDDEREPRDSTFTYWAKTATEVWDMVKEGKVWFISFDHDLGPGYSGYDLACWIESSFAMGELTDKIFWDVHSQNPVGTKSIIAAMTNYTEMERVKSAKETAEEGVLE